MVRYASLFSQLIALFNRNRFYQLVLKYNSERYAKGYHSWDHFIAMLFCQLAQVKSLREIWGGLACCLGKLRHLGMKDAPKKSTLSYANAHRSWQMFRDLFYETLAACKGAAPGKHKFRFKNKLLSLDSSKPYLSAYRFSPGPSFDTPKGPLSFTFFWIMMDTCPPMPIYRTGKDMTSRLPEKYLSLQVLLWPWIADTTITSFSRTGQRTEYSL